MSSQIHGNAFGARIKKYAPLAVTIIFIVYTFLCFGVYFERTLQGDINNHILSGERFGTPLELKERGLKPLYHGKDSGWDGQFYYYISNDLLGLKDTPQHIDAPSYRYQRVGMSLFAAITSKIGLQDWVSPTWYFGSYLLLLSLAVYFGGLTLSIFNGNPILVLFWALSIGTQITLFNALPDAAADAFLIIAIYALIVKRHIISTILFSFACLSREVYVVFPLALIGWQLWLGYCNNLKDPKDGGSTKALTWNPMYLFIVPIIVVIMWQVYITVHFGVRPSEQAHNILGYPLVSWWEYFVSGISGNHKLVGEGLFSYAEAVSLLVFLLTLTAGVFISAYTLLSGLDQEKRFCKSISASLILIAALYSAFGTTVMMHYTGYLKAISIFFFLIPFLSIISEPKPLIRNFLTGILSVSLIITSAYNLRARIFVDQFNVDHVTKMSKVHVSPQIECFGDYRFDTKIKSLRIYNKGLLSSIFGHGEYMILDVNLLNKSSHAWVSNGGIGGVNMSYHWVDALGRVVQDGIRSAILEKVNPGDSIDVSIISFLPESSGSILKLSPVQEGCVWFYTQPQ